MKANKLILIFLLSISPFYYYAYKNIESNQPKINLLQRESIFKPSSEKETDEEAQIINNQKDNSETDKIISVAEIDISKNTSQKEKVNNYQDIKKDKLGTKGRLYFPSLNFSVALYYANAYNDENYNAQKIVDDKDSAAYFYFYQYELISDHNYQGFNKIINLSINDKMYIKNADNTNSYYVLKDKFIGQNLKDDLVSKEGQSVLDMDGDLIIYTCYNKDDIIITIWDSIN